MLKGSIIYINVFPYIHNIHIISDFIGTEYDAQRGSTRVAWLAVLFAMTTLFAAYAAMMTAVLSVTNVVMPFDDVQGMYRDTDYKLGSVENTAFDSLFDVRFYFDFTIMAGILVLLYF